MIKTIRYYSFFILFMYFILFSVEAKEWPDNPDFVQKPFGAANDGFFNYGLIFESEGQRVKAWSNGEVIWTSDTVDSPLLIPGDGLLVLEHDDGFRSSYSCIEKRPGLGNSVADDEWLGYADKDSWIFEIIDIEQSRLVDPITLLPSRENLNAAPIGIVELVSGATRLKLTSETALEPGRWTIVVHDLLSSGSNAIPVEVSLFWVGEGIGNLRFDALEESDNGVVMKTPEPYLFHQIYSQDGQLWFPDILLNAGRGTLELRIQDELGSVVSRSWKLTVR